MRQGARVVANDALSPSVRRLLIASDDARFSHAPGQAIVIEAEAADGNGVAVRAPYSIASGPEERGAGVVEIVVARDAPTSTSEVVRGLPVGARILIDGPVGTFVRTGDAAGAPSLFVAAGTGLSPLRSMIVAELTRAPSEGPPLVLLYGTRREDEILWRDELEAWSARSPRFSMLVTLSRPAASWTGRVGWVQAHLDEAVARASADAFAFVCGPEAMVDDVMAILRAKHLPEARVVRERYG